jgi:pyrophosphate--fructose-6-phosphate 1-phosphotransferase
LAASKIRVEIRNARQAQGGSAVQLFQPSRSWIFMSKTVKKVGILTAGGLAPCLSAAIGYLIETYTRKRQT